MTDTTNTHLATIVYVEDNTCDALLLEEALREGGHSSQLLVINGCCHPGQHTEVHGGRTLSASLTESRPCGIRSGLLDGRWCDLAMDCLWM